ncbi:MULTISPECIES: helix-turn-helix domain-containing protein [Asticcacaulis]|uniref:helix-turn-helix domain-containing protein n=1 Tax=Asticcacaulis TaxID=76890 RepID=UPI001AE39293|nr:MULTISPECIES: helix-turn-helix transcriptional regulator [Asticcacaulis]MBP2160474.1 transcriptional regulator with XRE-family HTH domain [Asticcacaulis solisilvae]MDR6801519.1 transcriptional regulator with XRE-family HTH domain [Asticcacaulis sp. BE141]
MSPSEISPQSNQPHPVDIYVGARIRMRRHALGIGQQQLAKALDLSFQQVQKYESGSNRISSSKLYAISRALRIGIGYFFDGYGHSGDFQSGQEVPSSTRRLIVKSDGVDVALALARVKSTGLRRSVLNLIAAMAAEEGDT